MKDWILREPDDTEENSPASGVSLKGCILFRYRNIGYKGVTAVGYCENFQLLSEF